MYKILSGSEREMQSLYTNIGSKVCPKFGKFTISYIWSTVYGKMNMNFNFQEVSAETSGHIVKLNES